MMFMFFLVVATVLILTRFLSILTHYRCTASTCLIGKVAVVTGGNSGLGLETVLDLASRGCKVIIADVTNGEKIVARVKEESGNPNVFWRKVDLASLDSVREFAAGLSKSESKLDFLINNAGVTGTLGYTKDGLQTNMQINYFGHFLLTHLLIDLLKKSENSRVVSVSSVLAFTHTITNAEGINVEPKLFGFANHWFIYGNSKLCILISMKLMAERLSKYGISCYSVHPGAVYTPLVISSLQQSYLSRFDKVWMGFGIAILFFFFGKNIREGAQTTLHCVLTRNIEHLSGKYFMNGHVFWEPPVAYNQEFCQQIWNETEKLVKLRNNEKLL